jgi:hypothetical protein
MPMDERFRGFQNRQQDVHVRATDPATDGASRGRMSGRGLAIAIGVIAIGLIVVIVALLR